MAHSPSPWTVPVECAGAAAQDIQPKMLGELFREKTRWETANVMDRFPLVYYTLRCAMKQGTKRAFGLPWRYTPSARNKVGARNPVAHLRGKPGGSPFLYPGGFIIAAKRRFT